MPGDARHKISVTLALEELREQMQDTNRAECVYRQAMNERNRFIRDARLAGVRSRVLERITGLSRDRISRISSAP